MGNPVNAATGNKYQREVDYSGAGPNPLRLERHYNSLAQLTGEFGARWRHTYERRLDLVDSQTIVAHRENGREYEFRLVGGEWRSDPDVRLRLVELGVAWVVVDENDLAEQYTFAGLLTSLTPRGGIAQTVARDGAGRVVAVDDGYGRTLAFSYDTQGRVATVTDPDGGVTAYGYDAAGNLTSVSFPGPGSREYRYESTEHAHALTSIVDESGRIAGRWEYDAEGRATAYELDGGANRIEFTYNADGTTTTTDARDGTRTYTFTELHGVFKIQDIAGDPCTSCSGQAEQFTHEANGFIASKTDRNGIVTTYTRDARGLELSRTEAAGTPDARTIVTEWHPTKRLRVKRTDANREVNWTYDAAGRMTSETVRDLDTNVTRTTGYTYRADGLLETVTGPRGDVTTYAYDATGNLVSVTNALGHVTTFGNYDGHGHAGTITDPNGVITVLAYDARQRLQSRTTAGRTTQFAYDGAGRLQRVTLPTGSLVDYAYDAAGRLTAIEDALGNRIEYVLDATGNRTEERVQGPGGATVRAHFQVFDKLNRLIEAQGGAGQVTTFGYDSVGNRTSVEDAFQNTSASQFDALNRVFKEIDALNGETHFGYDDLDRLTQVVDPRGVTTGYTYNAFGDALTIASPDAGTSAYEYDAAGNRTRQTDARGIITEYDYDLLNRLIAIRCPAHPDKDITYTWDTGPFGIGRLARIDDDTGSTEFEYDAHGHVVFRVNTIKGTTLPLFQEFDGAGNLTSLMHPDGREVVYTRDAADRVTAITLVEPGGAQVPIATDVQWAPFGGITSLTFGNGLQHTRSYDLSGRVTTLTTTGVQQLTYQWDATDNITAIVDGLQSHRSQGFGYDALYRLTDATGAYGSQGFQYDAVGNRTQLTDGLEQTAYTYAQASNRLTDAGGKAFVYDAAGNTLNDGERQYVYDARNRMVQAGTYEYGYDARGHRVFKPRFAPETLEPTDPPDCDPKVEFCDDPLPPPDPSPPPGPMSSGSGLDQIGWILFQYDDAGRLIGEYDELGNPIRQYVWLDDLPIAMITAQGIVYLHADHLNTPRVATDGLGNVVWQPVLGPFGNQPLAAFGEIEMPLRFPGQYFDRETGLHHNWHREYAPGLGRYTQSDPIGLAGGLNRFVYAENSPGVFIDEDGLRTWCPPWRGRCSSEADLPPRTPDKRRPGPRPALKCSESQHSLEACRACCATSKAGRAASGDWRSPSPCIDDCNRNPEYGFVRNSGGALICA